MTALIASARALRIRPSLVASCLALLFPVPVLAQSPAPVPLPTGVQYVTSVEGISEYRLENGLRVLLFAEPTKANVTVNITYMVGSRHEDYGETGMAHLLEHLLFKGSTKFPNILQSFGEHGASWNGTTDFDRTNYFETVQASDENLQWALALEADRMVNSFIAKKDLDSEMTVVRNEFEAGENRPAGILEERTFSTAFLWHNYGKTVIGARSDIERVPIERLQAFYRHFYQPDNAVLVVAGKFDEAKTLALVHQVFSPIPKPTRLLRRTYTTEPTQDGERAVTLRRVGDVQAICLLHHIPAGPDAEFAAVEMAASALGDNPSGRLYKALVATGTAATVSSDAYRQMDPGAMLARASVRIEKSLDDAVNVMVATIDEIKTKPFTDEEINRAKTRWQKNFELTLNNSERVALELTEWQAQGDWRLFFLHRDRIRQLTAAQATAAAVKYFIASNRTIGRFIPDRSPARAEIPEPPDVAALLQGYKGEALVAKGEAFDASPENIDRQTQLLDLPGGLKLSFLNKKTRGAQVHGQIGLHFGDERSLWGSARLGAGVAAQLLMRGTQRHTREQIKDEFDRLKAEVNLSGGSSGAYVELKTTRENLKPVLDLVAEILREPSFSEKEFEELRQSSLAWMENQKSDPGAIASRAIYRHLNSWPKEDVRYVQTIDESIEQLKTLTLEQVRAFHRGFYGASHGEITLVGDFDPAAVQQQLSGLFSGWESPKKYARIEGRFQKIAPKLAAFETADKANASWFAAVAVQMSNTDPDFPALMLGAYIIGGMSNSRLFARVRGREGLSYGIGGGFWAPTRDENATLRFSAISAPQNAPKVEASFKDELNQIMQNGFKPEEVAAAKKDWLQSRQVERAEDSEVVGQLSDHRFWGRTMAWDAELEQKVQALTPEQVQSALRRRIDLSQMSYFRAGDFKKAEVAW